ncbi:putative germin-like protein 2-1 isoform X3 [Pyrus x bretschneideri]|uniref:putative germin-like protein 2-1 isoform X3 n=1 Tax=Pyrus x bretschneideri TaxID=225117 RepID=UPI00202DE5DA|nr:putative germin-like protein 2-1 isoform X3 [Pyrus x bretschneideri]
MATQFLFFAFLAVTFSVALASDPSSLQDFCVADATSSGILVNGRVCKDPKLVEANEFFFSGLHLAGNTSNAVGSRVTPIGVAQIGGLNALGITAARIDFAPWGLNPPHTHPRATEILTVLEVGHVHFQQNVGNGNAVALVALSSQNPGVITIANAVFGSNPDIPADILAKAFQVDTNAIYSLQSKF